MEKIVNDIVRQMREYGVKNPQIAVISGSGLSDLVDEMEDKIVIPFDKLEGMPITKVAGHKNQFIYGKICGKNVLGMQGRFHMYDGFSAKEACLPIYIFKQLGIETLIITNASGSLNENIGVGSLMIIKDHVNFTGYNALVGGPIIDYGEKFINMSEPYSKEYIKMAKQIAKDNGIEVKEGVHSQVIGPFYETYAMSKMLQICGCDSVGMSTVIEVEAAVQCNLKVFGVAVITDMAIETSDGKNEGITHEQVLKEGKLAGERLKVLLYNFIKELK